MTFNLQAHLEFLERKIDTMVEKYESDPCWINRTLLDCMVRDYESKQRQLLRDDI